MHVLSQKEECELRDYRPSHSVKRVRRETESVSAPLHRTAPVDFTGSMDIPRGACEVENVSPATSLTTCKAHSTV